LNTSNCQTPALPVVHHFQTVTPSFSYTHSITIHHFPHPWRASIRSKNSATHWFPAKPRPALTDPSR
jgi:hypothetical protein